MVQRKKRRGQLNDEENNNNIASYTRPRAGLGKSLIISQNIRSLNCNKDELNRLITTLEAVDIVAIQEIWKTNIYPIITGFKEPFLKGRSHKGGGGVGLYISKKLKCKEVKSPFEEGNVETIAVDVDLKGETTRIINVYRPPGGSMKIFWDQMKLLPFELNKKTIICGDFNLDLAKKENEQIQEFFEERMLSSMIDIPTRVKKGSKTIVDHIYTNLKGKNSYVIETDITDHYTTALALEEGKRSIIKEVKITSPLHSEKAIESLKDYLNKTDWKPVLNDKTKNCFYTFRSILKKATDKCTPWRTKTVKSRNFKEEWFIKSLKKAKIKKEKLKSKARKSNTTEAWSNYENYRNCYNKIVRRAKHDYYKDELEKAKHNIKKKWQIVSEVTGRKKKSENFIGDIKNCKNAKEKASAFNEHYSMVAPTLAKKIPNPKNTYEYYLPKVESVNKMVWKPVNAWDVEYIIKNLKDKTSFGTDGISNRVIKKISTQISWPLAHIINVSLDLGFIPDFWKTSVIKPLYKSGDQTEPGQYRPVNLVCCLLKVIEKAVADQVLQYCLDNNLMFKDQYGYIPNRNCEQLLQRLTQKIFDARNNSKHGIAVFLDLSKAFDTINHKILIAKLKYYGIPHKWFEEYLKGRKHRTQVEGEVSSEKDIDYGVIQGATLGPLLYLIYFTDIATVTSLEKLLFADDTTIWNKNDDIKELFDDTNKKLEVLSDWFAANQLSLNSAKTRYILFSQKEPPTELKIQGKEIQRVHEKGEEKAFKLCGVFIDENLTWKHHINHVKSKVSKSIAYICISKRSLTREVKILLYKALVESHLNYCLTIWGNVKESTLEPLVKLQKKAIRIITGSKYNSHTTPLFANINSLKLQDLYTLRCAELAIRVVKGATSPGMSLCFRVLEQNENARTRGEHSILPRLYVPRAKTTTMERMPSYSIPRIWRDLEDKYKMYGPIALKNDYKFYKKEEYSEWKCQKQECYACKKSKTE